MKYKNKTIIVDAIQYLGTGQSFETVCELVNGLIYIEEDRLFISYKNNKTYISIGDYIVKFSNGYYSVCPSTIFEKEYELFQENKTLTAKEMFEVLGYKQKIYTEYRESSNGIQYAKRAQETELQRIGMITTDYVEFYPHGKDILIYTSYEHKDGSISNSDSGYLNMELFQAVQQQIIELGWQNQ